MKTFDEVWELIIKNEHENFQTKKGSHFKYEFVPRASKVLVITPQNNVHTSIESFKKAYSIGRCSGPGEYTGKKIGGQSYVWAILRDKRINAFD